MRNKPYVSLTFLTAIVAFAQTQAPPPDEQGVLKPETYVRRFSIGATLSVSALRLLSNQSLNVVTESPAVDSLYTTTDVSQRPGYGLMAQLAVTERVALNAGVFLRKLGYTRTSDIFEGTDNINTAADERVHTVHNEDTRVRLLDFPLVLRYYGKDRHEEGPRWFLEGGGAMRRVSHVRTSIATTDDAGETTCCDFTPAQAGNKAVYGAVVGFGVQVIDPIGIRVVPQVRYTRWFGTSFNSLSTVTQRNQIEGMLSLTF